MATTPRTAPKSDFLGVSELAALRAENARLREALEVIAHSCECNGGGFLRKKDMLAAVRRYATQARAALKEQA